MKRIYISVVWMASIVLLFTTCKKYEIEPDQIGATTTSQIPILITSDITGITNTSANSGGNITSAGLGGIVTERGVCWNTIGTPRITDNTNNETSDGTGIGVFTSSIKGLTSGITYYIRAYATNSVGTAYGNEVNFKTTNSLTLPTLTTTTISSITATSATSGGNISNDGGAAVTQRGVCWNTTGSPKITDSKSYDGSGIGSFTSSITGLTANTKYFVRAFATNSIDTWYGNEVSFTTPATVIITIIPEGYYYIRNKWLTDNYINCENNIVSSSKILKDWWSAQWFFQRTDNSNSYRIRNKWKKSFLIDNNESVELTIDSLMPNAQWSIEKINNENSYTIKNKSTQKFLNMETKVLKCTSIIPGWLSSNWSLE